MPKTKQTKGKSKPKPKSAPSKPKPRRPQKSAPRPTRMGPRLSMCSLKFATAINDGFSENAVGACNPACTVPSTHKVTSSSGFVFTIGSSGLGWFAVSAGLASDSINAFYTNANYAGTTATVLQANNTLVTGVSYFENSNKPYTSGNLFNQNDAPGASGLIVSHNYRVRYTGTELNMGGMMHYYVDPAHNNLSGITIPNVLQRPEHYSADVSRQPVEFSVYPMQERENNFPTGAGVDTTIFYPLGTAVAFPTTYQGPVTYTISDAGGKSVIAPIAVFMVTGEPGNTFHVDHIAHEEYIGNLTSYTQTPHHSDPQGAEQVEAASGLVARSKAAAPRIDTWTLFRDALSRVADHSIQVAVPIAAKALAAMIL